MDKQDTKALWEHLKAKYSNKDNKILINNVRTDFHSEKYNPPNDTINAFMNRLREAEEKLASTDGKLSDNDLKAKLVDGLHVPGKWQAARQCGKRLCTERKEERLQHRC